MWGPSELNYNGTLSKEELATPEHLAKFATIPTLWTRGEDDECRPAMLERFHRMKGGAYDKLYTFLNASHCHHIEQEAEFARIVGDFIEEAERV
jgi:pimeloyl-ACP methyl ester carboxylesterase